MTTEITLTDKQRGLLYTAGTLFSGNVLEAAASVRLYGGAYGAVTEKLVSAGLLEEVDGYLQMTESAYSIVGIESTSGIAEAVVEIRGTEPATEPEVAAETREVEPAAEPETEAEAPSAPKTRKARENTKQAAIIAMLKRPEGATLTQITEATGWKIHTARAVLSRTIQKDLGVPLISEKSTGNERVYRVKA